MAEWWRSMPHCGCVSLCSQAALPSCRCSNRGGPSTLYKSFSLFDNFVHYVVHPGNTHLPTLSCCLHLYQFPTPCNRSSPHYPIFLFCFVLWRTGFNQDCPCGYGYELVATSLKTVFSSPLATTTTNSQYLSHESQSPMAPSRTHIWQVQSRKGSHSFSEIMSALDRACLEDMYHGHPPDPVACILLFSPLPWCSLSWGSSGMVVPAGVEQNDSNITGSRPQVSSLTTICNKKKILWLRLKIELVYQEEASSFSCQYADLAKQKW